MRRGLADTSDIVRELEAAPPSKKLMSHRFKELKGSDFFLKNPIIEGLAPELREIFSRTMTVQTPSITAYQGIFNQFIYLVITAPEDERPIESPPASPVHAPTTDYDVDQDQGIPPSPISTPGPQFDMTTPATAPREEIIGEGLTERTKKMHKFLTNNFREKEELNYLQMISGKNRKTVVGTFFELLVLKSRGIVDLKQSAPYGDILISKTDTFDQVKV